MRALFRLALLMALALAPAARGHACRLDGALTHVVLSGPFAPRWLVATEVEAASFDRGDTAGQYERFTTRLGYFGWRSFDAGVALPWAHVDASGAASSSQGFGNPVFYGRYAHSTWTGGSFAAGLQVEAPWATNPVVAAPHAELLPQLGVTHEGQLFGVLARVGLRWSFGGHASQEASSASHAHEEVVQLVDRHAERELLYRAGLSLHPLRSRWTHVLYVDGLHVLRGALPDDATNQQFTLGLQSGYALSWKMFLHPSLEIPLRQPARRDWRLSLELQRLL